MVTVLPDRMVIYAVTDEIIYQHHNGTSFELTVPLFIGAPHLAKTLAISYDAQRKLCIIDIVKDGDNVLHKEVWIKDKWEERDIADKLKYTLIGCGVMAT